MTKGRLIVIEGIDGSGKSTQIKFLKEALDARGEASEVISFPRYGDNIYGRLIKRYLEGEFGGIKQVNPYLMALAFAGDRLLAKPLIERWLSEGKTILANRYVSASYAHMGANLPIKKREEFFGWIDELEYEANGMPRADLTILLSVDPKTAQKNTAGEGPDIHEDSLAHLESAAGIYLTLAERNSWKIIQTVENGRMKDPQNISKELLALV